MHRKEDQLFCLLLLWEALEDNNATGVVQTVQFLATCFLIWIILAHWMDFLISFFVKWTSKIQMSDWAGVIYYWRRWCAVARCCNEISDCRHCQSKILVRFRVVVLDSNLMTFYSTKFLEVPCEWLNHVWIVLALQEKRVNCVKEACSSEALRKKCASMAFQTRQNGALNFCLYSYLLNST
jgi:hypothetical protein